MSRDPEPEPLDVLVGARVRPGGRRDGARDDHHGAGDDADERDERSQRGATGAPRPRAAPRLERDDDRERDDDEREQEVRHHRERVELEDHGDPAERDLRDRAEERGQREAHAPSAAGRRTRRDASQVASDARIPHERDDAVPELDERVEALRGERRVAAARPVVAAEARPGQPHEGADVTTSAEHDHDASARWTKRRDETGSRERAPRGLTPRRHPGRPPRPRPPARGEPGRRRTPPRARRACRRAA